LNCTTQPLPGRWKGREKSSCPTAKPYRFARSATPADDTLARAAEERGRLAAIPRHAAGGKERHFDRNWSIHPRGGAKRTKQGEEEFKVADQHAAAEQTIERRALTYDARDTIRRTERVDVVASDQRRVADIHREDPLVFAAAAVAAVVNHAGRNGVERRRHQIATVIDEVGERQRPEGRRCFQPVALT